MMFLPYENIIYKTKLNPEEVKRRLQDSIEPEKLFRFGFFTTKSEKPYEGKIVDPYFRIKRNINYRNSFMPKIFGCIEANDYTHLWNTDEYCHSGFMSLRINTGIYNLRI